LDILEKETRQVMGFCGCAALKEIQHDLIYRAPNAA
jgi:isopentenyl diphosphate isomerase/L-lactate dehydrogenase-like FMN-dependent dehydrogenase